MDHQGVPQLIIILLYLGLLLLLGVFSGRLFKGTKEDYQVASHSIGPFMLLMSMFGTTMTAFALVGSTGESFREGIGVYGMMASSSGIVHSLCFFVIGVKVWRLARRNGYTRANRVFSRSIGQRFCWAAVVSDFGWISDSVFVDRRHGWRNRDPVIDGGRGARFVSRTGRGR